MVNIYKQIPNTQKPQFTMPKSLRIIKEASENGIDWKCLHIADLFSIIYSIRIDNALDYLERQRKERMHKRGISEIRQANEQDFDNL